MSYLRIHTYSALQNRTPVHFTIHFNNQRWHVLDGAFRVVESFRNERTARQWLTARRFADSLTQ